MPAEQVVCERCGSEVAEEGPRLDRGAELCDPCVTELVEHLAAPSVWVARRHTPGRPARNRPGPGPRLQAMVGACVDGAP